MSLSDVYFPQSNPTRLIYLIAKPSPYSTNLYNRLVEYHKKQTPNIKIQLIVNKESLKPYLLQAEESNKVIEALIFFHWNYIVPKEIWENYKSIVIHTSNLPEGRGGSPIQNQITQNINQTYVNALKMTGELDAGPIYAREPITLQGTIDDIWDTISHTSFKLINNIIDNPDKTPLPQLPPISQPFKRLKNTDNLLISPYSTLPDLQQIYDKIRMLDGPNYPPAYLKIGPYTLNFSRAKFNRQTNQVIADVTIFSNN